MLVLKILMGGLIVLVTLPLLLLCLPLGYAARGKYSQEETLGWASVDWGWGLFKGTFTHQPAGKPQVRLSLAGFRLPMKEEKDNKETPSSRLPSKKQPHSKMASVKARAAPSPHRKRHFKLRQLTFYLNRGTLEAVTVYLKDLLHHMKPNMFQVNLIFGLEDPYQTAQVNNVLMALWPLRKKWPLHVQPLFFPCPLDASGQIEGKLVPVSLLWITLRFLLQKPVRSVLWSLFKERKASHSTGKTMKEEVTCQ